MALFECGGNNILNYSTTEQNTGIKWIDGKSIYQKTYSLDVSSYPNNQANSIGSLSELNIDKLISLTGMAVELGGQANYEYPLNTYIDGNVYVSVWKRGENVGLYKTFSVQSVDFTLYYTKKS